jgi:predicted  nucleic acid-binding Zn-ribbon protein
MAKEPENLVLVYLRRVDEKVDRLRDDVRELKSGLSELKTGLNGVRRDLIALAEADARLELIVDRQGERLDKIERRLDLRDS